MSSEAFGETLQFITNVKLQELEKKKQNFSEHRIKVQDEADKTSDQVDRLSVLVEGMKNWPGSASADFNIGNVERWIEQARRAPGFPEPVLAEWIRSAEALLNHEGTRYEFAGLFGRLLKDWIQSSAHARAYAGLSLDGAPEASLKDAFETISRKETSEQKEKLETLIFKSKEVDVVQLEHYLNELFSSSKEASEALEVIRERIGKFAESFRKSTISVETLAPIINSVLALDVLSDQKKATLKMFKGNSSIVAELASVLNMQLTSLQSWSWPETGVMLEPLRHLNGKTRFYLDSEILTCLLLHYIGVTWAAEYKSALQDLRDSKAWKKTPSTLLKKEYQRRAAFFKPVADNHNVNHKLRQFQEDHFFMCQMPSSIQSEVDNYKDSDESSGESSGKTGPSFDDPVNLKQSLLHIICADILLKKTLFGQCHVVRTDLEWFGPSLPFQTILTVLKFFGMPESELKFVQSFLSCPIIFKDDPSGLVRTRQRGVPISYMLSTLAGELTLFVMDFAVNQRADGLFLYRIHDDFWFWDAKSERCATAWEEINKYASFAGLTFNTEKTGYVAVGRDAKSSRQLPRGDVRWGFLLMDQKGRFVIDKELVSQHITEFGRQLNATTSLFGWTQAFNKYMLFIIRNCGEPAFIYGQAHIDEIIETVAEVQRRLFPNEGKFIDKLAEKFLKKFGVSKKEIPMGWYLWPNAAGGLEIKDPFANLFLVRDSFEEDKKDRKNAPEEIIAEALKEDERQYYDAKERWEVGRETRNQNDPLERGAVSPNDPFFSLEEFRRGSDDGAKWWLEAFEKLLRRPARKGIKSTPRLEASVRLLGEGIKAFGGSISYRSTWSTLSPYWQWVISIHHDEMVKKFGSLAIVDPESVPVGMVSVFKSTRMRWEQ